MGPWVIFPPRNLRSCVTCWSCQRCYENMSKEHLLLLFVELQQQPWLLHLWKVKNHNPDVNPWINKQLSYWKSPYDSHTLLMTILQAVYVADEDDAKAVLKKPEERGWGGFSEKMMLNHVGSRSTTNYSPNRNLSFLLPPKVHRKDDLFSHLGWMDFTSGRFHRFRWWKLPLSQGSLGEIHVLTTFTTLGDGSATTWWAFGNATDCAWLRLSYIAWCFQTHGM